MEPVDKFIQVVCIAIIIIGLSLLMTQSMCAKQQAIEDAKQEQKNKLECIKSCWKTVKDEKCVDWCSIKSIKER